MKSLGSEKCLLLCILAPINTDYFENLRLAAVLSSKARIKAKEAVESNRYAEVKTQTFVQFLDWKFKKV